MVATDPTTIARAFLHGPARLFAHEDVLSIKDTGATGDGQTDDTDAIERAIRGGAKTVFFPRGTYRITRALSPAEAQVWQGEGSESVTIIDQDTPDAPAVDAVDTSSCQIWNMHFKGGRASGSAVVIRSQGDTPADWVLFRVNATDSGRDGFDLRGTYRTIMIGCQAHHNGRDGFRFDNGVRSQRNGSIRGIGLMAAANDARRTGGANYHFGVAAGAQGLQDSVFIACTGDAIDGTNAYVYGVDNRYIGCHMEGRGGTSWDVKAIGHSLFDGCTSQGASIGFDIEQESTLIDCLAASSKTVGFRVSAAANGVVLLKPRGDRVDGRLVDDRNGGNLILHSGESSDEQNFGTARTWRYGGSATGTGRRTAMKQAVASTLNVSTTPATILSDSDEGAAVWVKGKDRAGAARFVDLVLCGGSAEPSRKVDHDLVAGSPAAARRYTRRGSSLLLTMASGSYDITVHATQFPNPE